MASNYLIHKDSKSKYKGGFITKNGRKNNSSAYNHDYYLKNLFRWKKKDESDPRDDVGNKYDGSSNLSKEEFDKLSNNAKREYLKTAEKFYKWANRRYDYTSKELKEFNKYKAIFPRDDLGEESKRLNNWMVEDINEVKKQSKNYGMAREGVKEAERRKQVRDQSTKNREARKERLNKQNRERYKDVTKTRPSTVEELRDISKGKKFFERNTNKLFSKTRKVSSKNGVDMEYKDVGILERGQRKVSNILKKKFGGKLKIEHDTSKKKTKKKLNNRVTVEYEDARLEKTR